MIRRVNLKTLLAVFKSPKAQILKPKSKFKIKIPKKKQKKKLNLKFVKEVAYFICDKNQKGASKVKSFKKVKLTKSRRKIIK